MEIINDVIAEAECETCSKMLRKKIQVKNESDGKSGSIIDLYCPFCKQYVKAKVPGELYLKESQQRQNERLRKYNLDKIDEY